MPNLTDPKIFQNITSPIKYRASYIKKDFTVTWNNWDGSQLKVESVGIFMSATPPNNPTRDGYTFSGWSNNNYTSITSNLTITALFNILLYTVRWMDWDGSTLKEEKVEYKKQATPPTYPTRVGYVFSGWDTTYTSITKDITITAQYVALYTVKWNNWDGSLLKQEEIEHGKSATPPNSPTRTGYIFSSWDKQFTSITSDITLTAMFDILSYTVRWLNWDGELIKEESVQYEESAIPPSDPIRDGYVFIKWDKDFSSVTSSISVTAIFKVMGKLYKYSLGISSGLCVESRESINVFPNVPSRALINSSPFVVFSDENIDFSSVGFTGSAGVLVDKLANCSDIAFECENQDVECRQATLEDLEEYLGSDFTKYKYFLGDLIGKIALIVGGNTPIDTTLKASSKYSTTTLELACRQKRLIMYSLFHSSSTAEIVLSVGSFDADGVETKEMIGTSKDSLQEITLDTKNSIISSSKYSGYYCFFMLKSNIEGQYITFSSNEYGKYADLVIDVYRYMNIT